MAKSLKKSAKRAADDRQQDTSAANIDPRTEADIGRLVDKYKNRSESSLMDELLRVTEQQKRDGTLGRDTGCRKQHFADAERRTGKEAERDPQQNHIKTALFFPNTRIRRIIRVYAGKRFS